jgi:dUTPase
MNMNSMDTDVVDFVSSIYDSYMLLNIYVDSADESVILRYKEAVNQHVQKIKSDARNIDAGFDLFSPDDKSLAWNDKKFKLDFGIVCQAKMVSVATHKETNTGFYMYPRSSISKTAFRLANNVGIVDAGYRGHLMGMFDVIDDSASDCHVLSKFDRLVQICAPGLVPIIPRVVDSLDTHTLRGTGGIGSTGK